MEINYIEEELKKPSIFLNESKLSPDYVPRKLLHREEQFKKLSNIFKTLIEDPGGASKKIIIHGPVGTGKTAVTKRFSYMLMDVAKKRGINLKYLHVNCRINKTCFLILKKIVRSFDKSIPKRGYSSEELIHMLKEILEKEDCILILVLDEVDFLKKRHLEILYYLSRLMDDILNPLHRLSLILIGKTTKFLDYLDISIFSSLHNHNIYFNRYNKLELKDIIGSRAKDVFYKGVISEDTIMKISEIAEEFGDIRYALELLWKAGKEADFLNLFKILPDFIQRYEKDTKLSLTQYKVDQLTLQQKIILKSIIESVLADSKDSLKISHLVMTYSMTCIKNQIKPYKHTKIWENLKDLEISDFISIKISENERMGRSSLIKFNNKIGIRELNILLDHKIKEENNF